MPEAHMPKKSVCKFDCQRAIAFLNLGEMGKLNLLKTRDKELHFASHPTKNNVEAAAWQWFYNCYFSVTVKTYI